MAIKGMRSLQAKLKNIADSYESNKLVRAGFLGGSRYPEAEGGTPVALWRRCMNSARRHRASRRARS